MATPRPLSGFAPVRLAPGCGAGRGSHAAALGRRMDDVDEPLIGGVQEPELNWIHACARCRFVHQGFEREVLLALPGRAHDVARATPWLANRLPGSACHTLLPTGFQFCRRPTRWQSNSPAWAGCRACRREWRPQSARQSIAENRRRCAGWSRSHGRRDCRLYPPPNRARTRTMPGPPARSTAHAQACRSTGKGLRHRLQPRRLRRWCGQTGRRGPASERLLFRSACSACSQSAPAGLASSQNASTRWLCHHTRTSATATKGPMGACLM